MQVRGAVAVVTGAAGGIGAALARRFAAEGAAGLLLADLDADAVEDLAGELDRDGCRAVGVGSDVSRESDVKALVDTAEKHLGPIDLFCSNAGVGTARGIDAPDALWQAAWDVNVMSHVYAARAVVPGMLARGRGWLLNTASAAGLLTMPGDAPYSVTKHAAVAFAEWLSMTYGGRGVGVSVLCPQGVRTGMTADPGVEAVLKAFGPMLEPDDVAAAVVAGLAEERFLILPHPEVARYEQGRVADRDAWLAGMREAVGGVVLRPGADAADAAPAGGDAAATERRDGVAEPVL
ncbi:SDR family NAD(P)-dependent oxidoreductase [Streptacidiphilus sp. ASG 303]|uniref:SDR family oxidoreductase n=1 Tax=Streptacidiphilus sp. ASG 303 TaxID=2896847 RepID=UPI001E4E1FDE|nr:SDR family NAD(P)-dependent oxidoreductase [Streptacidiphilus sp. ASG 303]MCD0483895.1 SDR family NAD(P)-dependent oxidoreductase [Streptacidiphilus sp. ASG 303]